MKTKQFCCTHSIFLINTEHLTLGSFHWIYFNWFFFWTYTHGIVCSSTGFHLFLFFQPGAHWYENICPSTLFHSAIRTMGKQNLNGKTLRIHLTQTLRTPNNSGMFRCAHQNRLFSTLDMRNFLLPAGAARNNFHQRFERSNGSNK